MQDTMAQELALASKQLLMVSSSGLEFHPALFLCPLGFPSSWSLPFHHSSNSLTLKPKLLFTDSLYPAAESQSGLVSAPLTLVKLHLGAQYLPLGTSLPGVPSCCHVTIFVSQMPRKVSGFWCVLRKDVGLHTHREKNGLASPPKFSLYAPA